LLIKENIRGNIKRSKCNFNSQMYRATLLVCDLPKDLIIAILSSLLGAVFTIISFLFISISQYEKCYMFLSHQHMSFGMNVAHAFPIMILIISIIYLDVYFHTLWK